MSDLSFGEGRAESQDLPVLPAEAPLAMPVQSLDGPQFGDSRDQADPITRQRRRYFFLWVAFFTVLADCLQIRLLGTAPISPLQWAQLILFLPLSALLSCWFVNSLVGYAAMGKRRIRASRLDPSAPLAHPKGRTAILAPVYNEDPSAVTARLLAMARSLAGHGAQDAFDIFILSDTRDLKIAAAEVEAFHRLRAASPLDIYYRRRPENTHRKSGNLAEWVQRFGAAYPQMIVLDADSLMTGEAMLRLVGEMERRPDLGLIQTLPVIVGAKTLFARWIQFGTRLYGQVAAAGLAWWSGAEAAYWGHNAVIRTRAFAESCGLPELKGAAPFGGHIMSHDVVEAGLMRRAGWTVMLEPTLPGSYEEAPPTVADFMVRDRRWCQGNVQHIQLVRNKTFHPMNRSHFFMGVMAYLTPPLCLVYLMVGAIHDARRGIEDVMVNGAAALAKSAHFHISLNPTQIALLVLTFAMVLGPKILGLLRMLSDEAAVRRFGGKSILMRGFVVEIFMSVLVAPVIMLAQSRALVEILLRRDAGWKPQNRSAEGGTSLKDCARLHGWQSVLGLALVAGLATSPASLVLMIPILTGLTFAVLLAWALDHPRFGQAFREMGLLVTAEERRAPDIIRAATIEAGPAPEDPRWHPVTVAGTAVAG